MTKELGVFEVDLDGRFSTVRSMESNLCNFVTDIMVASTEADFALINSGTFRSDTIHKAGTFTIKDLLLVLPMIANGMTVGGIVKSLLKTECLTLRQHFPTKLIVEAKHAPWKEPKHTELFV